MEFGDRMIKMYGSRPCNNCGAPRYDWKCKYCGDGVKPSENEINNNSTSEAIQITIVMTVIMWVIYLISLI